MKLKHFFSLSILSSSLLLSNSLFAKSVDVQTSYSVSELETMLKKEGYSVEKLSQDRLVIKVNGIKYGLFRYPDGDLQMAYGATGIDVTLSSINDWNTSKRLSRAYRDADGDPMLESDLELSSGVSKDAVLRFVKLFIDSAEQFRSHISK